MDAPNFHRSFPNLAAAMLFGTVWACAASAQQPAALEQAAPPAAQERWLVVLLDAKKVGHAVERTTIDEQGNVTSSSEMSMRLERMGEGVSLSISGSFTESPHVEALRMTSAQELGASRTTETYEFIRGFAGSEVLHTTESQGRTSSRTLEWPDGDWLTPAAAAQRVEQHLAAGDAEFSVTTLDPTVGLAPITQSYVVLGREPIDVFGKAVPAIKWSLSHSAMPGVTSTEFVDASGALLRSELSLGGMTLTLLAADRDVALAPFDAPEMMARTLITPTGARVETPRRVRSASFVLGVTPIRDTGPVQRLADVPDVGAQRAERLDDRRVRVTVETGRTSPAGDDAANPAYLGASTMIDPEDPEIRALVDRAIPDVSIASRAQIAALRRAVSERVSAVTLGVGLATASEAVRTGRGDCTEFAVLLAAALRAAGIPSRVASGVVYVDQLGDARGVFGYHMWTQALVNDASGQPAWIDVDAALPGDEHAAVDATHIALAVSAMDAGDGTASLAAMLGPLGRLTIEVEHAR
jgi:hypothetical protein